MCHAIRFNSNACDAQFLRFDNSGARSAKRIENRHIGSNLKLCQIFAHQMWRVGQHEPIPVVNRAVFDGQPVGDNAFLSRHRRNLKCWVPQGRPKPIGRRGTILESAWSHAGIFPRDVVSGKRFESDFMDLKWCLQIVCVCVNFEITRT